MLYLPNQDWSTVPRNTLNATAAASGGAAADRQVSLAAAGARVPIIYGRDRRGALLANIVSHAGYLWVCCVWGLGPIDAVESITLGDKPLPAGYSVTHYLGAPGQGVSPGLAAAFAGNGIAYADTLPGIAYSVLAVPIGDASFDPSGISAIVRGRLLYDPRSSLTAYSENPALVLADWLSNTQYGMGLDVDWASVGAMAAANEAPLGGEPRRRIGLTLSAPQPREAWADTLRNYAGCFVVRRAAGWSLVPDAPVGAVKHFDHASGNIARLGPIKRRSKRDAPTVMHVRWTDTSSLPWRDAIATAYAPGVLDGSLPWRESEVAEPGIQSASQAQREAVERLNKLSLSDLSFPLDVFDDAGALEPGDVVTVTHPVGLDAKPMRVTQVQMTGPGRYTLSLAEYDAAVYSVTVVTNPTTPDTSLPSPSSPTPVTGLAVSEELVQLLDGTWASRLRVSWAAPDYPWVADYRINVRAGAAVVETGTAPRTATSWPSAAVQERVPHQVDVVTRSQIGAESVAASVVITPQGKYLPPGNVPSLTGYEVGGEVRLRWDPATDIDIWRYEIRWGAVGVAWADAARLDRVDALSLVSRDMPAGTWNFLVCALDSVGQYSPIPARKSITVTLDAASILVDRHDFTAPVATGMQEYSLWPGDPLRRWVSEDDVPMASKFSGSLSSYLNPMAAYSAGTGSWQTEAYDFGLTLSGNWTAELSVNALAGTVGQYLDLSQDGSSWVGYAGLTAKTGGRFSRLRVDVSGAALVLLPVAQLRIDAIPREEEGVATSSSSGPYTVTLNHVYSLSKGLPQITVAGTGFATATVDNITVGNPTSFDVYVFDDASNLISRDFGYVWKGI